MTFSFICLSVLKDKDYHVSQLMPCNKLSKLVASNKNHSFHLSLRLAK